MCKVDWDWELGEALGGTDTYCSLEDILEERECAKTCGVVKITLNPDKTWTEEIVLESKNEWDKA